MSALIREYDVPFVKQYMTGRAGMPARRQGAYFGPAGTIPGLTEAEEPPSTTRRSGCLYAAMEGVSATEPWLGAEAARLDAMTFATWIEKVARKGEGEGLFHAAAGRLFRRAGA